MALSRTFGTFFTHMAHSDPIQVPAHTPENRLSCFSLCVCVSRPDGVILFSDILTPLPGLGVPFDIDDNKVGGERHVYLS